MKKQSAKRLCLSRETLYKLDAPDLGRARGGLLLDGTLTVEPPCADTDMCPPPGTGCTSTLSCTE
jgi:hypothetical protein